MLQFIKCPITFIKHSLTVMTMQLTNKGHITKDLRPSTAVTSGDLLNINQQDAWLMCKLTRPPKMPSQTFLFGFSFVLNFNAAFNTG